MCSYLYVEVTMLDQLAQQTVLLTIKIRSVQKKKKKSRMISLISQQRVPADLVSCANTWQGENKLHGIANMQPCNLCDHTGSAYWLDSCGTTTPKCARKSRIVRHFKLLSWVQSPGHGGHISMGAKCKIARVVPWVHVIEPQMVKINPEWGFYDMSHNDIVDLAHEITSLN